MGITINTKNDAPLTYVWEIRRFRELAETSNKTTTGFLQETSDTSAIVYTTAAGGQQGLLNEIFNVTLEPLGINWSAVDWNTLLTELDSSFDALETPTYSSVSATGLRELVLSGNKNGALTQTLSGESAINLLGDIGGFYRDSNGDGLADGWQEIIATNNEEHGAGVQKFTLTAGSGASAIGTIKTDYDFKLNDILLVTFEAKTDNVDAIGSCRARLTGGAGQDQSNQTLTTEYQKFEWYVTITDASNQAIGVVAIPGGIPNNTDFLNVKKLKVVNLTNEGDTGLSEANALLKYAKYFDNIGHTTINQKITGTNGEFELKEPYVFPKDPAGVASEIVTLDGQNFARMKHKLFVLDGDLNIVSFLGLTNTYRAFLNNALVGQNILYGTEDSGDGVNNDAGFSVSSSADALDASHIYLNAGDNSPIVYINKALVDAMPSGGTLAGFKEYLNANPIHAYFRIDLSANYIDIPIKHLASIEGGTFINNSTILPSAITLTYPTNEAGERESSQISQNQITTVNDFVSGENVKSIYKNGLLINEQGEYSQTITNVYENGLLVLEFDNTSKIVSTYENGLLVNEVEVEL